jgi:putative ribosome biogenesis GTPase RsgA
MLMCVHFKLWHKKRGDEMRGLVIARAGAKTEIWLPEEQRVVLGIPRGKLIKQGERIYAGDWVQVRNVSPHEVAIDAIESAKTCSLSHLSPMLTNSSSS